MATIPKILHHMWLDKTNKYNESAPDKYNETIVKPNVREFIRLNPSWQYWFWNADRIDRHVWQKLVEINPEYKRFADFYYNTIKYHIERCDFSRYAIMWLYGGLYTDLKLKCLRNLDSLLFNSKNGNTREFALAREPSSHRLFLIRLTSNSFLASIPGHEFWIQLMDYIIQHYNSIKVAHYTTGPAILTKFLKIYLDNNSRGLDAKMILVPSYQVFPIDYRSKKNDNDLLLTTNDDVVPNNLSTHDDEADPSSEPPYFETKWLQQNTGWAISDTMDRYGWYIFAFVFVIFLIIVGSVLLWWYLSRKNKKQ